MSEFKKIDALAKYINIFGNANETIQSIQKFIDRTPTNNEELKEEPAASINRVLGSLVCENTQKDINKIIQNL